MMAVVTGHRRRMVRLVSVEPAAKALQPKYIQAEYMEHSMTSHVSSSAVPRLSQSPGPQAWNRLPTSVHRINFQTQRTTKLHGSLLSVIAD